MDGTFATAFWPEAWCDGAFVALKRFVLGRRPGWHACALML
jgi:hypothetical protein